MSCSSLDDFSGTARLFPLPDLVLFPHVVQPLHIFEHRYRQLMADALVGDRLIAMALLRPGWEKHYHKRPPIQPTICVGRIYQEELLLDGRYNFLLRGLRRARIDEEQCSGKLYRSARVTLLDDVPVCQSDIEANLRDRLAHCVTTLFATQEGCIERVRGFLESGMPLGSLCDIFSYALPLETEVKYSLLEDLCVERRARRLLCHLEGGSPPPKRCYPPGFSEN
jgi:uncharacterized protein